MINKELISFNILYEQTVGKELNKKFGKLLKSGFKKIMLVYHGNDIDGQGNVVLIKALRDLLAGYYAIYVSCKVSADEAYDEIIKSNEYDICFIVDLSFSENVMLKINDLEVSKKIILLDHHETALYLNKMDWAYVKKFDILNFDLTSGTLLLYILLRDLYTELNMKLEQLSKFAWYTAAYDTWFANDLRTCGACKHIMYNMPRSLNYVFKYNKKDYADNIFNNIINGDDILSTNQITIANIMHKNIQTTCNKMWHGCTIEKISNKNNTYYVAICYVVDYTSDIGDYILKKQPEISVVMMINPNINTVSFRSRSGDINVTEFASNIAKTSPTPSYGGHQPAAGAKLPIENFFSNMTEAILILAVTGVNQIEYNYDRKVVKIKDYQYDDNQNKYIIK